MFEYRDCNGAIDVLADLAVPGQLADEKDQLEVHRMLGICYAQQDDRRAAAREFSSLLSIDPDHQLDPFEVPPPVIELFEAQKQIMKARLDELRHERERARAELGDSDGGVLLERTTTLREVPLAAAFLPFGLAQAANGQTAKAFAFGGVQGVALLVNVVGYWGAVTVQAGAGNARTANEAALESIFWYSHVGALGVLASAYAAGVVDAWWNHEDQLVLNDRQTRRPLTAGELKKLRRIERAVDATPEAPANPATTSMPAPTAAPAPGPTPPLPPPPPRG